MRRVWRDEVVPLAWWAVFVVLMFVVISACIPTAAAAPASPGEQFAHDHAADICIALDSRPTIPGLLGVLTGLDAYGLSPHESGVAVATSVITACPIHKVLLRQFIDHYRRGQVA